MSNFFSLLIRTVQSFINLASPRIITDGGVTESEGCNHATLQEMRSHVEAASLIITPYAYAEDKLYAIKPTSGLGDLTWTRATADDTYINSGGLIEKSPYNLFQRSEEFDNAYWLKNAFDTGVTPIVTADFAASPLGTITSDRVQLDSGGAGQSNIISPIFSTIIGQSYTFSVYLKSLTVNTTVTLFFNDGINVNVTTEWQRFTFTRIVISSSNEARITKREIFGSGGAADLLVWGAQLVQGSVPKDYFHTTDRLNVPRLTHQAGGGGCPSILVEPQRTNLVFPSAIGATQTRTVTAVPHTLTLYGTGSVTLSGVATGTLNGTGANDRVSLTFTPTAGSLTLTVTGSVTDWQLEAGSFETSLIITTTATVTRIADTFTRDSVFTNGLISASGGSWFVELENNFALTRDAGGALGLILGDTASGSTNSIFISRTSAANSRVFIRKFVGAVLTDLFQTTTDNTKILIKWNSTTADVFVNGVKVVASTAFTSTDLNFLAMSSPNHPYNIEQMWLFDEPISDAKAIEITTP